MAQDYGLSQQDIQDLQAIRAKLPTGDVRASKIDTLLGTPSQPQFTSTAMTDSSGNLQMVPHTELVTRMRQGWKIGPPRQQGDLSQNLPQVKDANADYQNRSGLGKAISYTLGTLGPDAQRYATAPGAVESVQQAAHDEAGRQRLESIRQAAQGNARASATANINSVVAGGLESAAKIARGGSTPQNAALTAAATAIPVTRVPIGLYVAGKGLYDAFQSNPNESDADATERRLLDAASVAGGAALTKAGMVKAPPAPVSKDAAIENVRQAVNPAAVDSRTFLSELNDQMDTLANHAKETGQIQKIADSKTPGQSLSAVADIAESAAKADPYYTNFIKPYENTPVTTTRINGYKGGTVDYNTATIGQLSQRLKTINATLSPKYVRGGGGTVSAQAAVDADQAASMQAEATAIRNTIADELSRRTGVPVEDVRNARQNYGQLSDTADTMRYYADQTLQNEFTRRNQPLTPGDLINIKGRLLSKPLTNPVRASLMQAFQYRPSTQGIVSGITQAASRNPVTPNTPQNFTPQELKLYYQVRMRDVADQMRQSTDPAEIDSLSNQLEGLKHLLSRMSPAGAQ